MQPARSPDADEWVSQRVREREGTHEEAPASARAASLIVLRSARDGPRLAYVFAVSGSSEHSFTRTCVIRVPEMSATVNS